ncbi:MAG: hypothetical protein ACK5M4_11535 [Pseudorhodobacter sp.]
MFAARPLLALFALAACAPPIPDSGAGVGYGYPDYTGQQQLQGLDAPPVDSGFSTERIGAAIDNSVAGGSPTGQLVTPGTRPRGNAPGNIRAESGELRLSSGGISDEQNFDAVSARETIESDAQRIAQNRAQYQVITPTVLPQRSGESRPNIVQFALATSHGPGTQLYRRGGLFTRDVNAACAKFASPDLAQEEFLVRGGPERDRLGVDPDGDGFACGWDPRPFRAARQ